MEGTTEKLARIVARELNKGKPVVKQLVTPEELAEINAAFERIFGGKVDEQNTTRSPE